MSLSLAFFYIRPLPNYLPSVADRWLLASQAVEPITLSQGEGLGLQLFSINFSYKNYTDCSNLAPSPSERAGERSKLNDIGASLSLVSCFEKTINSSFLL
jgi:hypothetical protein